MWIISTFDPKFQKKTLRKNIERYWEDKIIHIKKSKLFYWTKIVLPASFWTAVLIFALTMVVGNIEAYWLLITIVILFVLLWLIPIFRVIKFYLDYKMDFVIVNPHSLIRYNQEWFFKRISKTIDLKDIRSTSVRKSWLMNSIFNNGNLLFLSEAWEREDEESMRVGEIVFRYVYHPDLVNSRVNKLLAKIV